ncbi:MAG: NAD(P)H-quinone dehydrogenase [Actinomycetia bacterium]|nr:NAD(P)H-quinone dehydrogenase [Actinomycetes bacterium]
MWAVAKMVIIGGGPGGYEAALVAAQVGAEVTLVDRDGLGGSAVLTDVVPSKGLITVAGVMDEVNDSRALGVRFAGEVGVDLAVVNGRLKSLATAQSADVEAHLLADGVRVVRGSGRLDGPDRVAAELTAGGSEVLDADAILIATGAQPRELEAARPDGERILSWTQLYDLSELPAELIVIGSGVTGAEFAGAYQALGSQVTLVSSRDRVLPGEDADAALVLEEVFQRRGMKVLSQSRAVAASRTEDGVAVELKDGRTLTGSHVLMAVGSLPNTDGIGLKESGIDVDDGGFIKVDRVSRTSARGVYAAGDCTGVLMLASVAAMQGRIAMKHALGEAVQPLDLSVVSSNVFTDPEIATVGVTQRQIDSGEVNAAQVKLPLATNARAKMQEFHDGFVKLFCRVGTGIVIGGVVVAPRASELIYPVSLAVRLGLNVDQVADAFTIYPSLSGSVSEAARQLHLRS